MAVVALGAIALGLAACTTQYVRQPNVMVIQNQRPTTIQSLAWASCDASGEAIRRLPNTTIAPHRKIEISLLPGCVNLFALDAQGHLSAEQYDLRMQPGSTWRIQ